MKCYVDSSVILGYLLTENIDFERVQEFDEIGSSELVDIECRRVLHRYRLDGAITDTQLEHALTYFGEIYRSMHIIGMERHVKQSAAQPFPTIIGTLDAIHLASASLWAYPSLDSLVVFTFDRQMRLCAQAMGLHVL